VFDNGRLRFGTGSESLVNSAGNLKQPFYFSDTDGAWHKLTYSSYPLDMALGMDYGNAANWAGAFVGDFYSLPVAGSSDDASQFVETSQVGHIHNGYGNYTTRRTFTFRGAQFNITNTYRLGAAASFIQIDTTTTNVGSTTIWNARLWAGTRDDWVWNDDSNIKTRGNLAGGGFVQLADAANSSNALLVSNSINETVLFYSTTPGANMVWNRCCSFSNAYNQDPATNAVRSSVMDGSYATTLLLGDLAPGQSSTINCESGRLVWVCRRAATLPGSGLARCAHL
jgi:hypothetical protein